ncbi:MAG: hypothetical protein HRU46_06820 [Verrucomicrobiales bacterium]|nr:hypothetical protein [Verrucomicrobiales bacterium]
MGQSSRGRPGLRHQIMSQPIPPARNQRQVEQLPVDVGDLLGGFIDFEPLVKTHEDEKGAKELDHSLPLVEAPRVKPRQSTRSE